MIEASYTVTDGDATAVEVSWVDGAQDIQVRLKQSQDILLLTPDQARDLAEAIRLLLGDEE